MLRRRGTTRLQLERLESRIAPTGFGATALPPAALPGISTATVTMPWQTQASLYSAVFGTVQPTQQGRPAPSGQPATPVLPPQAAFGIAMAGAHNAASQAGHSPIFGQSNA